MTLVPRLLDPSRLGNGAIVIEKLHVPGIQDAFFVKMLPVHRRGTVVRNHERRHAAEEGKRVHVTSKPGGHLFIQKALAVEVAAVWQRHDKHMNFYQLSGVAVYEMPVVARPVSLSFQAGDVTHGEADIVLAAVL